MLSSKYITGCLASVLLLAACKKDSEADIKGEPGVKFFTNNESLGNLPSNSMAYNLVNYPNTAGSGWTTLSSSLPASIKIPVFATKPVSEDVTINAELDNALVAEYNATNKTSYLAFPADVLNTANLSATIRKDYTYSTDSISIPVSPATLNTLIGKGYLAPIKLTTISKPSVGDITATTSSRVAYVVLTPELRRIKYLATAAEAVGSLVTARTAWMATLTPAPTIVGSGSILDGSTATYSRWTASPGQVDLNMQTTRNVTGVRLFTSTTSTVTPTQIDVSVSEDGVNYDLVGSPLRANLTYGSGYTYVLFYKAIPAKYIRLKLYYSTSTSTQNFRLAEMDVYTN